MLLKLPLPILRLHFRLKSVKSWLGGAVSCRPLQRGFVEEGDALNALLGVNWDISFTLAEGVELPPCFAQFAEKAGIPCSILDGGTECITGLREGVLPQFLFASGPSAEKMRLYPAMCARPAKLCPSREGRGVFWRLPRAPIPCMQRCPNRFPSANANACFKLESLLQRLILVAPTWQSVSSFLMIVTIREP